MDVSHNAVKTAPSWDSFKKALYMVLDTLKPEYILEYGPGISTTIMALYPSVKTIYTVEHDKNWFEKFNQNIYENVFIEYQPQKELYAETKGNREKYDLIFIDGIERVQCLYLAKNRLTIKGVVLLHDAERFQYKDMVNSYRYKFYFDGGHTVVLTDFDNVACQLEEFL